MTIFRGLALAVLLALVPAAGARAADGKIAVVAAENFYGDIARQIGGDQVAVVSIMSNPDQDPHLFETTPGIGAADRRRANRHLQRRRLRPMDGQAAEGGAAARPHRHRRRRRSSHRRPATIRISGTIPPTMPAVAKALAAAFSAADPAHKADYEARLDDLSTPR